MKILNKISERFSRLSNKKRMQIVTAATLTICMLITIPSYAWFNEQKKAAEMFKVQNPNALYINAAHREDRVYFDLGEIDVNGYERDEWGNTIYYQKNTNYSTIAYKMDSEGRPVYDELNHPVYDKDAGEAKLITERQYVFSVSGSNTDKFTLQMAHTNNNKFTYEVYDAKQYKYKTADELPDKDPETGEDITYTPQQVENLVLPANTPYIKYTTNKNSHNEDQPVVEYDEYDDSADPVDLYYVRSDAPVQGGEYKNNNANDLGIKDVDDKYYGETYEKYTNVHEQSVPSYWQAEVVLDSEKGEIDANKSFSKYYILRVTWDKNEQNNQEKKETDMIYLSVKR